MTSALDPDSSFSLSAQQYGSNSEFIFVKLTDAAIEAIEQFARNQNNKEFSSKATIQFLENEGFLSIPTNDGDENQSFSFSLAEEEKQEEFELLEESGGAINVLGGIHSRLRVHAREDVYEKTRHNMLEVAQTQKNKWLGRPTRKFSVLKEFYLFQYKRNQNQQSINPEEKITARCDESNRSAKRQ